MRKNYQQTKKEYEATHKKVSIFFSPEYSQLIEVYTHKHGEHIRVALKEYAQVLLDKVKTL